MYENYYIPRTKYHLLFPRIICYFFPTAKLRRKPKMAKYFSYFPFSILFFVYLCISIMSDMTIEEFNHKKENLAFESRQGEIIRLCRKYVEECRQSGDLDNLAEALDSLYSELSVNGSEEDAKTVFNDLFALRKALAQHNLKENGEAYAVMLHKKAISCQEEAINIYKELGLYDSHGFDIDWDDAFGFLGQLYCYKGDYASGIHYTTIALERALREGNSEFNIGLYNRRLGIAYLLTGNTQKARECIHTALDCFERSSRTEPDPTADTDVINSCMQLLTECSGRSHPDDYFWQWLI